MMLTLDNQTGWDNPDVKIRDNLSAAVRIGEHLWLGGDEGTALERLTMLPDGSGGHHQRFELGPIFDLPKKGGELDIEGLDISGGYLWLTGSHSQKRAKPKKKNTPAENIRALSEISTDMNRFTLARLPLADGAVKDKDGQRRAARMSTLAFALKKDPHIAPFLSIPSKDNGLDIEGLAVKDTRVFLGLRGPVLRGWAVILDLAVEPKENELVLTSVRKHFLQMDGLGVRDLLISGKDMLILAGPTMNLDGPAAVYNWKGAVDTTESAVIWSKELQRVLDIPVGRDADHPEGMTFHDGKLLVVYDSPSEARCIGPFGVKADLFAV